MKDRGYLDQAFFTRPTVEFPRRGEDIARVAGVWDTQQSLSAPVSRAAPMTHAGILVDIVAGDKRITGAGPAPTSDEARRALDAIRGVLLTAAIQQPKLGRALDDALDALAAASPVRAEVSGALARILKFADRTAPNIAEPLAMLLAWLGPEGDRLRP